MSKLVEAEPEAEKTSDADPGAGRRSWLGDAVGLVFWIALIRIAIEWGRRLPWEILRARWPPLMARYDPHFTLAIAWPIATGGAVLGLFAWARRLRWRTLVVIAVVAAFGWILVLNLWRGGGLEAFGEPYVTRWEYAASLDVFDGPLDALARYHDLQPELATHARAHPPGALITVMAFDAVVPSDSAWVWALWTSAAAASIVAAAALVVRRLADESTARLLLPILVLAPYAIWSNASLDAVLAAGAAWIAVLWLYGRHPVTSVLTGVAFGALVMTSYGLVPFALVLVALRRDLRGIVLAAAGAAAVLMTAWGLGFFYPQGIADTRIEYLKGYGMYRSHGYWMLGNMAAAGIAAGPAVALSVRRAAVFWREPVAWVTLAAVGAVVAMTIAGVTKAEVERIWLPYLPWMLILTIGPLRASWERRPNAALAIAGVQAAWTIGLSALIRTPW